VISWTRRYRDRTAQGLTALRDPQVRSRLAGTAPAIVLPVFNGTGLGIVRDLGRRGVPVIALDNEPRSIGLSSRYAVPGVCPDPRYDENGLLEYLERLGAALPQRAVVFPAFDDHVWALSRNAERLSEYFIMPFAGWDVMSRLVDKETQMKAAWEAGVDTPKTVFVHGPEDLDRARETVPLPALFKPLRHQEMRRRFGVKLILVRTPDDLQAAYEKACVCGALMYQEFIPGGDTDYYTFGAYHDSSSRPLGMFVSRKVRQHPRLYGESRIAESVWVDDVAEASLTLLAELSFHGVSGTEFKRDPRDGRLKLMEVNARHWLHHALASTVGVDLSWIAYRDALGEKLEAPRQRDGTRWIDLPRELRDSASEMARGEMEITDWLTSLGDVRVDAVYSFDDPMPGLRDIVNGNRQRLRRIAKLSERVHQ
jgi:D-aspartate ligase